VVAARFGYIEIVELLLESGVDVHAHEDRALMCSIAKGHHSITNRLIQRGASSSSPVVAIGLQLHRQSWIYIRSDIEPWHNNVCPPQKIKRKTLLEKLVSAVCKPFYFSPQHINHHNSD
jgi:ankyrin repeat protein